MIDREKYTHAHLVADLETSGANLSAKQVLGLLAEHDALVLARDSAELTILALRSELDLWNRDADDGWRREAAADSAMLAEIAHLPDIEALAKSRPDLDLAGRVRLLAMMLDDANSRVEALWEGRRGSLDFPDLRDIKPGQYTTSSGVSFEVPCNHPTSTEECCGNQVVYGGCSDDYGMLGEPMCCGKPIRRCDRCGAEGEDLPDPDDANHEEDFDAEDFRDTPPATIIGAADYPTLGITDATPAKDVLAALLAQKPERVGPSQYECADCHEPLAGLGATVHECRPVELVGFGGYRTTGDILGRLFDGVKETKASTCPGCTDPAGLAYHDPKLCRLEWTQDRWCRRCQRDTDEPEIGDATGICQECLSETNHCLRCGQHRSRCEHGQEKRQP